MRERLRVDSGPASGVVVEQPDIVGEVVAAVLGRDRHGGAGSLDGVVGVAAGQLLSSTPPNDSSRTLVAAEDLTRRGDRAGARLLLRAVARVAPHHDLETALDQLRPAAATRRRIALLASVMLAVGLLAGGVVAAVVAGADGAAGVLLAGSVGLLLAARVAWVRHIPLPGLTLQESRFWRSLGVLGHGDISELSLLADGRLRRAIEDLTAPRALRHPSDAQRFDSAGWVGLAGVFGAVLGLAGGLAIPTLPQGAFLVLMLVSGVVAAVATRTAIGRSRPAPRSSGDDRAVSSVTRNSSAQPGPR